MTYRFAHTRGPIIVPAQLVGPSGVTVVRLGVDTGSGGTILNPTFLTGVGYDLTTGLTATTLVTAGGPVAASYLTVSSLTALGRTARNYQIAVHALPHGATIDGLLGLDFFRDHVLTIDFQNGEISLTP
jgi:hypothetical protein